MGHREWMERGSEGRVYRRERGGGKEEKPIVEVCGEGNHSEWEERERLERRRKHGNG